MAWQIEQEPRPHRRELDPAARVVGPRRDGGEHRLHRLLDGQAARHPHRHGQAGRVPRPQALPELPLRPQLQEGDRGPRKQGVPAQQVRPRRVRRTRQGTSQ